MSECMAATAEVGSELFVIRDVLLKRIMDDMATFQLQLIGTCAPDIVDQAQEIRRGSCKAQLILLQRGGIVACRVNSHPTKTP